MATEELNTGDLGTGDLGIGGTRTRDTVPARVSLREITGDNRAAVTALRVVPGQESFVDGVTESFEEAARNPEANPWLRAIYAGDSPVGFVMLADDVPPHHSYIPYRYYLWRLLIDASQQQRGHGRAALDALVEHLATRPGADELVTSVVLGEGSPLDFYVRYGFARTGEMFDEEAVLRLPLGGVRES